MSITTIPNEIILHIGSFFDRETRFYPDTTKIRISYPMWDLFATCKSFSWLRKFEYLCVEFSGFRGSYYRIIPRNINGTFYGICYQERNCNLMGYYGSDKPKEGYNYSKWNIQDRFCHRENLENIYFDYDFNRHCYVTSTDPTTCVRFEKGSCGKCALCIQLDTIQQELSEKDPVVADIIKNDNDYRHGHVIIREKKPMLNFKFDYTGFNCRF